MLGVCDIGQVYFKFNVFVKWGKSNEGYTLDSLFNLYFCDTYRGFLVDWSFFKEEWSFKFLLIIDWLFE